ncbi:helix-turn-helix domain-containing protein [Chitinophaga varians]|uniref:helix-turn-helix domain-containing protein n=1 Tax=Chitinophaga varians TaxID=2202339 RepID=UPI00165ED8C8|nr:helix-turn-helix transcriptional regulator [Chitinophaga varians]MBC9913148.1 helix-turn-helix transcriptional regulator [Chitinophaga varians]
MTPRENFAKNIRFLRETMGLSREDVSVDLDISRQRYAQWELGNGTPGYNTLSAVARYFNQTIDRLLNTDIKKAIE